MRDNERRERWSRIKSNSFEKLDGIEETINI